MLDDLIGQLLGRYRLSERLGEGAVGAIFRAHDAALGGDAAIIVVHPHLAAQPGFQERFLQEAAAAARRDHPGIVKVFDSGQADSLLYVVTELIPGPTLRQHLDGLQAAGGQLAPAEAAGIVRQVCLALEYARSQGALQRSIKPEDIALKPEGVEALPYRPVLTDLGLARLVEGGAATLHGASMAAPAYMSPEQAIGDATDTLSDVYCLGVLLYELVVGRPPFPARTLAEAIRYHTKQPPPPPRAARPDVPEALETAILRALQKDPAGRFAGAGAMASALAPLAEPAPPPALPAEPGAPPEEPPPPQGEPTGDLITIVAPDGSIDTLPCRRGVIRVGRSPDNHVVLDYAGVEAHHARLHFDGRACRVESTTAQGETYLGGERLTPGAAEVWAPDRVLRVGSVRLRLEQAAPAVEPPAPAPPPAVQEATPPPRTPGRLSPWLAVAAAIVLLASAGAAYAILRRPAAAPMPVVIAPMPEPTQQPVATRPPATVPAPAPAEPTAPPTSEPTAEPPPAPTPSPTVCVAAGARFAAAYAERQAQTGCPRAAPVETWMAVERFEHGLMFWSQDSREIYVLIETDAGAVWSRFADTWAEGQPEHDPSLVPPAGLQQPVRGFGKVWREQLGGPASKIGWATEPEQGFGGGRQAFANGLLMAGPGGEVYALFADGRWDGP